MKGTYNEFSHTVVFSSKEASNKRTDAEFRAKNYGKHHKQDSPLLLLDMDMIKQFPVGDSLHLLHMGVMKRLLFGWRDGVFRRSAARFSADQTEAVSRFLTTKCKMPREIHRAVRGLDCLAHWKGLECRTFLLYVGAVVLKDKLSYEAYQHFLTLFCAVTICESRSYHHLLTLAREMLKHYVENFRIIYGQAYMTSNVHNLLHLVDDVEYLGELQTFTAYPFENMLGIIKRLIRSGYCTLNQVAKRLLEIAAVAEPIETDAMPASDSTVRERIIFSKQNEGANVPRRFKTPPPNKELLFYSRVDFPNFSLSTDSVNMWFLTTDNNIVHLNNVISVDKNSAMLYGVAVREKRDFFDLPIGSSTLNIFAADHYLLLANENIEGNLFDTAQIKCKLVRIEYSDSTDVFFPLLHTLK